MLISKNEDAITSIYTGLKYLIDLYGDRFVDQLTENIC